ncbi:MAG: hypothetical protein KGJ86_20560, partial [Chloroflexota bacterium]|nr:hypothetical protein [Chloroflexota bacterium]
GLHHVALWQLLAAMIAFAVIGRSIGDSIFVGFLPSLGCAIALALIPIVAVLRTRARRQERILDQLDHICSNVINRCLTGSQVSDALNVVVSEGRYERGGKTLEPTLPAPLGPELVTLYRDVFMNAMGFAEACEASARRIMHPVYANFMTELVVASTSQSPAQSLTDFRVTLEADRQLERFVTEEFSPWIAQAALVPLVGTGVLIATRFTMPNAQAVLSHPLGQIGFLIGWALALANILFMRSQARFEAVLVGAEF